ncbi:hypothetical protein G5I_04830 [Acromyrmex echinatior]|uniref:Uncharacterized protein n=1 Tax=Acromyrmex echinatior TaxID=103372 RepID=F4WGP1_ACREC|nr:hypothetical protein G5I_04830 [Acromyrmex echinatior]
MPSRFVDLNTPIDMLDIRLVQLQGTCNLSIANAQESKILQNEGKPPNGTTLTKEKPERGYDGPKLITAKCCRALSSDKVNVLHSNVHFS